MAENKEKLCGYCVFYNGEMGDKNQFCDDREEYRNDTDIACCRFRRRRELTDAEKAYEWLDETRGGYKSEYDCEWREICFEALKKQIPKPPKNIKKSRENKTITFNCPNCNVHFEVPNSMLFTPELYCSECGQKILWEE